MQKNREEGKYRNVLIIISSIAYLLGAFFLFIAPPPGVFLSPGISIPGLNPLFLSMLLLAATSIVFIVAVFKKDKELQSKKISKETGKYIAKNLEKEVDDIASDVVLRQDQAKKDFNKFIYIIGILSIIFAGFQAWEIFSQGTAGGVSIIAWGAYLAIAAAWFGYGIYYQNKPIMLAYGLFISIEILIINGILIYN